MVIFEVDMGYLGTLLVRRCTISKQSGNERLVPTRNTIPLSWLAPDKVTIAVLAASNSPGTRA